ncbi:MAG: hypothetical protein KDJ62_01295 [Rhodobiaceae bacterium]|nr:hypothetical protein [Rhodobiaceae bacterium]MCC0047893.1 hypothetical protein [Rhodobiaceae bacterium]
MRAFARGNRFRLRTRRGIHLAGKTEANGDRLAANVGDLARLNFTQHAARALIDVWAQRRALIAARHMKQKRRQRGSNCDPGQQSTPERHTRTPARPVANGKHEERHQCADEDLIRRDERQFGKPGRGAPSLGQNDKRPRDGKAARNADQAQFPGRQARHAGTRAQHDYEQDRRDAAEHGAGKKFWHLGSIAVRASATPVRRLA